MTLGKLEGELTGEAASILPALLLPWPVPGGLKGANASARSISTAAKAEGRQNGALWPWAALPSWAEIRVNQVHPPP
jgi:hypothetical protein